MEASMQSLLRGKLVDRRRRLASVQPDVLAADDVHRLIGEVDAALARMEAGTFGVCETCHDSIEADRLRADPLIRYCLDHLTPAEQRDLERDLELAARIQGELLPKKETRLEGWAIDHRYEPLGAVSGDYCDLVSASGRGGGTLFALLGDVAGKGVSASILMAQLHATFRSLIDVGLPLREMMDRANRLFCESVMSSQYATLVCARATRGGEIEIGNAGHLPPLHVHAGRVERVAATGLPLGLFCGGCYATTSVAMHPGDSLVLYTDGITEARDPADREYGAERLAHLVAGRSSLPPHGILDACLADLSTFRGGARRTDDLTLMVIRRE